MKNKTLKQGIEKIISISVLIIFLCFVIKYILDVLGLLALFQLFAIEGLQPVYFGLAIIVLLITVVLIKYLRPKQFISDFSKIWKKDLRKKDKQRINNESIKILSNPWYYLLFVLVGLVFVYSAFDVKTDYRFSNIFRLIFGLSIIFIWIILLLRRKKTIDSIKKNNKKKKIGSLF